MSAAARRHRAARGKYAGTRLIISITPCRRSGRRRAIAVPALHQGQHSVPPARLSREDILPTMSVQLTAKRRGGTRGNLYYAGPIAVALVINRSGRGRHRDPDYRGV